LSHCVAFRGALAHRIYVAFRDNARAKRPPFDTTISARKLHKRASVQGDSKPSGMIQT